MEHVEENDRQTGSRIAAPGAEPAHGVLEAPRAELVVEPHRFAVQDEVRRHPPHGLHDAGQASGDVVQAAGEYPHVGAAPVHLHARAVELPFDGRGSDVGEGVDQPATGRFDGENQNFGLVSITDDLWPEVTDSLRTLTATAAARRVPVPGASHAGGSRVAGRQSSRALSLHANQRVLAQPGRGLPRHPREAVAPGSAAGS